MMTAADNRVDVGVSWYDKKNLTVKEDRSVDVYVGPKAPDGL